tara:strand:+ start:205 stop:1323 length:1119 start_codon:yes stop_codon:yes gene_type:complete
MNKTNINKIVKFLGNPNIFVFGIAWMIILVVVGTLAQRDIGLYQAQQLYFSNWIGWFGFIPFPSGRLLMLIVFFNLSFYFLRPNIFKISKLGTTITHFGALLLLFGGGITAYYSQEGRMAILEGKISNYFEDYYNKELVVINTSNEDYDEYTTFDEKILYSDNIISNSETIPFQFKVLKFFRNCEPIRRDYTGDKKSHGLAKNFYLEELDLEKEYERNISGVIIDVMGPDIKNNGIYILFQGQQINQPLLYNGVKYDIELRSSRTYLPFEIELIDFKKILHPNTDIPKSFSSDINLIENSVPRYVLIKMNEPLRHNEYTFYQSSFLEGEIQDISVFAVVKNYGRLFPYISSIIMCIGILFHLLLRIPKNKRV